MLAGVCDHADCRLTRGRGEVVGSNECDSTSTRVTGGFEASYQDDKEDTSENKTMSPVSRCSRLNQPWAVKHGPPGVVSRFMLIHILRRQPLSSSALVGAGF